MAKMTVKPPDALIEQLQRLGDQTDRIVSSSLKAAAEPIKRSMQQNCDRVVGRPLIVRSPRRLYNYGVRSTGGLRRAIGISPVKVNRKGDYDVKVGFAGEVPGTKITYGRLAGLIENGCRKRNQPPRPFVASAKRESAKPAAAAFQKKFDEEVKALESAH